jgi:hypothetical protein
LVSDVAQDLGVVVSKLNVQDIPTEIAQLEVYHFHLRCKRPLTDRIVNLSNQCTNMIFYLRNTVDHDPCTLDRLNELMRACCEFMNTPEKLKSAVEVRIKGLEVKQAEVQPGEYEKSS